MNFSQFLGPKIKKFLHFKFLLLLVIIFIFLGQTDLKIDVFFMKYYGNRIGNLHANF